MGVSSSWAQPVERYGVFETSISHDASLYDNPFTDVGLDATFTAPSGTVTDFHGFYDGDGAGGNTGNVWKLRFMPEETGTYTYTWAFSDGSASGEGTFSVVASDRKPPLQVCQSDPRWLCYGGEGEPVLLKAYYGTRMYAMTAEWTKANIYEVLAEAGYNHIMMEATPSSWRPNLVWSDYNGGVLDDPAVENETAPFDGTVNLNVWHRWDEHLGALNDLGIQAWLWTGLGGSGSSSVDFNFADMSAANKKAWVKYWMARWAPFAHVAWSYWYEKDADDSFWTLLDQYDPFDRLRSGQWHPQNTVGGAYEADATDLAETDWYPVSHASNWRYKDAKNPGKLHRRILDDRAAQESVSGTVLPYYNSEGALWTSTFDINTDVEDFAGLVWATITAEAYFNWSWATACGSGNTNHCASSDLLNGGYHDIAQVAYHILESEVPRWYDLENRNDLLASEGNGNVWAMAEPGTQYLVFSKDGSSFELTVQPAEQNDAYEAIWIDARTGDEVERPPVTGSGTAQEFVPPSTTTDWVLVLRSDKHLPVELKSFDVLKTTKGVLLQWATLSETENAGFEVQYRTDDAWDAIAFLEGAGTTNEVQSYTHPIERIQPGRHRFRLKQIDFDGTATYSEEVEVVVEPDVYRLSSPWPSPFEKAARLALTLEQAQPVRVEVYDVLGRRVATLHEGSLTAHEKHTFTFESKGRSSGVYIFRVTGATFTETRTAVNVK